MTPASVKTPAKTRAAAARPLKLARTHLLRTIERALSTSGLVRDVYPRYTLDATPYRIPGKRGNHGVRVTWTENPVAEKTTGKKAKR